MHEVLLLQTAKGKGKTRSDLARRVCDRRGRVRNALRRGRWRRVILRRILVGIGIIRSNVRVRVRVRVRVISRLLLLLPAPLYYKAQEDEESDEEQKERHGDPYAVVVYHPRKAKQKNCRCETISEPCSARKIRAAG
jgi:hypothetical protein